MHSLLFLWNINHIFSYVLYQYSRFNLERLYCFGFFFSLYSVLSYCSLPSFLPALLSPTPLLYDDINGNQIAKKWRSILKGHHLRETLDVFGLHFECCICVPSCTQKVLLTQQSSREFNSVIQAGSCQTEMEAFFLRKEKKLFEQFIRKMWQNCENLWIEQHLFWNVVIRINIVDPFC